MRIVLHGDVSRESGFRDDAISPFVLRTLYHPRLSVVLWMQCWLATILFCVLFCVQIDDQFTTQIGIFGLKILLFILLVVANRYFCLHWNIQALFESIKIALKMRLLRGTSSNTFFWYCQPDVYRASTMREDGQFAAARSAFHS